MAKGYSVFLGETLLPVSPSSISTKINNRNERLELINDGEVNILKKKGLTDISFDFMIPHFKYPFANYTNGFKDEKHFLGILEELKDSQKPFQFIVSRVTPNGKLMYDTNMKVSLESYSVEESAENGLDLIVSIELKQFKEFSTKTVDIQLKKVNTSKRSTASSGGGGGTAPFIGCTCTVNGHVYRDSYGNGAGALLTNYTGKINFIKTDGRSHPYHITNMNGGFLGWVTADSVSNVKASTGSTSSTNKSKTLSISSGKGAVNAIIKE